jgi:photosystem II stability/assembly factor-like uncharacterized protein
VTRQLRAWLFVAASVAPAAAGQWTQVGPPGESVQALAIDPIQASTLYAGTSSGVFKSSDYGATWQRVYSAPGPFVISVTALALDAAPGRAALAAGTVASFRAVPSSPLRSIDNGQTWAGTGPTSLTWPFLIADGSAAQTFYAGADANLFRTRDDGLSWNALPVPLPPNAGPSSLAIDPRDSNTLLLGLLGGGVLRSADGGASWQPGNTGLAPAGRTPTVTAVALDPSNSSVAYAAGGSYSSIPFELFPNLFRSTDGGLSWASIAALAGTPNVQSIATAQISPASIISIATSDHGVLQTRDQGDTWMPVNAGLPSLNVTHLWASQGEPGVLYAASAGRLFRLGSHECVESPTAIATAISDPICPGQTATLTGSGGVRCLWSPATGLLQPTACVTPARPGATTVYFLRVTDAFGCPSSNPASVVVTVLDAPPAPPITAPTSAFSGQRGLAATVPAHAGNAYRWSASNGTIESGQGTSAVTFAAGSVGTMSLSVNETNSIGCVSPDSVWNIAVNPPEPLCAAGSQALCLEGRFKVETAFRAPAQATTAASPTPLTLNAGAFWFFSSDNLELVVKVLDGRSINGRFWVFYGSLTNVEFTLTVTDRQTGAVKTYFNPQGQLVSVADTSAF